MKRTEKQTTKFVFKPLQVFDWVAVNSEHYPEETYTVANIVMGYKERTTIRIRYEAINVKNPLLHSEYCAIPTAVSSFHTVSRRWRECV